MLLKHFIIKLDLFGGAVEEIKVGLGPEVGAPEGDRGNGGRGRGGDQFCSEDVGPDIDSSLRRPFSDQSIQPPGGEVVVFVDNIQTVVEKTSNPLRRHKPATKSRHLAKLGEI